MDSELRGVFATPGPIEPKSYFGLSVVKLQNIKGRILHIENIDTVDETPLLDIKPYVPEFDEQALVHTGWLEGTRKTVSQRRSDKQYSKDVDRKDHYLICSKYTINQ